jgi:Domain of unknown function (DUF4263)
MTLMEEGATILNEAKDERPLQEVYTIHPYLLALAFGPHCCCVFPLPRLGGGQHIPDFLYCDLNSLGYQLTLIELESPTMEATNKDESISRGCHHAVEQILDYRHCLAENALAEQNTYRSLNDRCEGYVVIGRREDRSERVQRRLSDFRQQHIEIASYDRLLSNAKRHMRFVNHNWAEAEQLAVKVRETKKAEASE